MPKRTDTTYRNQIMYSVFVRNHSNEGTFEGVRRDLKRIKGLGVDVIWLLPIHPVGEQARKGTLGSPYAIQDYRAVNPEYGTLEDFERLVADIHNLGMKCVIDVVYNHTSPDSWLAKHHPEWFFHKPDGSFGNRVGDWSDVIDLDYSHDDLCTYQIETLKQWAAIVDGFRCDVASLVPLHFWLRARDEVEKVRPGCLWLSESIGPGFVVECRSRGQTGLSDSEIFQAFDISYEYDIFDNFKDYLTGNTPLEKYAEAINRQEFTYSEDYVKLRYLENHDNPRAAFIIPDKTALVNWTAFIYFQKGMTLLYAGQEVCAEHCPSLFDKDTVDWNTGKDLTELLTCLGKIKKHPAFTNSQYEVRALSHNILSAYHRGEKGQLLGVFSLRGECSLVRVDIPDGKYQNMIDESAVEVRDGMLACKGNPIILEAK